MLIDMLLTSSFITDPLHFPANLHISNIDTILLPASPFQTLSQTPACHWSPWEQSPIFLQQRLSLNSPQNFLPTSSNAKTTSQPIHHRSTEKLKNESENSFHSEKSPLKAKPKVHKSVRSLIERPERDSIDDCKYLSNSLSCLDVSD
jgi:hypothetical protein